MIAGGCGGRLEIAVCTDAELQHRSETPELCEQAWLDTASEDAAVAAARHALSDADDAALRRWVDRALPTVQGARILHFWADRLRKHGELIAAEAYLRRALALQVDRDPARATNTAFKLLELVQSNQPAEETLKLARLTWEQAQRHPEPLTRAFAASTLANVLLDLGELEAAHAVIELMNPRDSLMLKSIAEGRLQLARGHATLAVEHFKIAGQPGLDPARKRPLRARISLAQALLDVGRTDEAREARDRALETATSDGPGDIDSMCRLAAVEAEVLLAEHHIPEALAAVDRGLALNSRDSARVLLLNVRGDALAQSGDFEQAERTWQAAADSVEAWRASIPNSQLRSGLVEHHRQALEAWLESTASRGDVDGALEVTRRMAGRGLLDRIHQRVTGDAAAADSPTARVPRTGSQPASADAWIDDVVQRLAAHRELAATMATAPDLRRATHDMVALMAGSRSLWAIRRICGHWSVTRIGERGALLSLIDAYRGDPDDPQIAAALGDALFPHDTLPATGGALVVLLDRDLADVPLAGLRVASKYLVEYAPILELLTPELLFAPLPDRAWEPPLVVGDPSRDLENGAREATAVAAMLGVAPQLGARATRAVLAPGSAARVLHVATHAGTHRGEALLALADGTLSALDIVKRRIAPRVAVVATCRSQIDDDPATSLVAALLAAGASGVVGVKRSLDDADGANLMLSFYRAGGADSPLQALADAQRAAIARGVAPHAWATVSFFGVGGWIGQGRRSER